MSVLAQRLWLKVGGDKGGKTFKMSFQIVNTKAPNSTTNTCVFSIFEATQSQTLKWLETNKVQRLGI